MLKPYRELGLKMQANIHHYDGSDLSKIDDEGDTLIGFYYQFLNKLDVPVGVLMGPYNSATEAEQACQSAFNRGDS